MADQDGLAERFETVLAQSIPSRKPRAERSSRSTCLRIRTGLGSWISPWSRAEASSPSGRGHVRAFLRVTGAAPGTNRRKKEQSK
jgi:hypothetical protein